MNPMRLDIKPRWRHFANNEDTFNFLFELIFLILGPVLLGSE